MIIMIIHLVTMNPTMVLINSIVDRDGSVSGSDINDSGTSSSGIICNCCFTEWGILETNTAYDPSIGYREKDNKDDD